MSRTIVAAALVALLAGCSSQEAPVGISGSELQPLVIGMSEEVLGLDVQVEDVSQKVAVVDRTWAEQLSVYSLRRDELVQATFQATRIGQGADVADESFRRAIVETLGSRSPRGIRVGPHDVWVTTGTEQMLAAWFHDDLFFVLAIRSEYEEPLTLLRTLLEVRA